MLKKAALYTCVCAFLLSVNALGQGNGKYLPPNHINPHALSQGAQAWWLGLETSGARDISKLKPKAQLATPSSTNVDAANPNEDVAPGQSETAMAAAGNLVMAAWNDVSGLVVRSTTQQQVSGTGVGFSRDRGKTFHDRGGLPNGNLNENWFGDPSVVAVDNGAYFIVSSLYLPTNFPIDCSLGPAPISIAISVGTVTPNAVEFTNPIIVASGGDFCSSLITDFLDKDFMSYDPHNRILAISYTRFTFLGFGTGQIEVLKAHLPTSVPLLTSADFSPPIVVWPEEPGVENEGSYPLAAFNPATGHTPIYVAWERNWGSNLFNGDPYVYIHAAWIPFGATSPAVGGPSDPVVVTLGQLNSTAYGGVKSLSLVPVPGYSRGISNDFPRIAWDAALNQVAIVWNDASHHPLGDIFLRTFDRGLTNPGPIEKLNSDHTGALHMFPAVCFLNDGSMVTSWYDRRNFVPDSTWTDLFADIRSGPYATPNNFKVTTVPTNWADTSSLLNPNFGDYTDNACSGQSSYFTWSDGRLGYAQPFVAP